MVQLTKLNGNVIVVNADLVEFIEETPDCLLSMTTGRRLMVRERLPEVLEQLREYRRGVRGAYAVPAGGEDIGKPDIVDPADRRTRG
jgi:flagellar protein FlbD